MAKRELQRRAVRLRRDGKSYNQIRAELGVSKSTLSLWLRSLPLSAEQMKALRTGERRIEAYRATMLAKKEERLQTYYQRAQQEFLPLLKKELQLAGILLYWGEGTKTTRGTISICNTNPAVIKFAMRWLTEGFDVPRDSFIIRLHLYSDMNVAKIMQYWSNELDLPLDQFGRPYIKESKRSALTYKSFGHGTCNLVVYNTELKERIMMAIRALADYADKR